MDIKNRRVIIIGLVEDMGEFTGADVVIKWTMKQEMFFVLYTVYTEFTVSLCCRNWRFSESASFNLQFQ